MVERRACQHQPVDDGYGQTRSGTYVSPGLTRIRNVPSMRPVPLQLARFGSLAARAGSRMFVRGQPALPFDFAYGSEVATFPVALWNRILARCARRAANWELNYGRATGNEGLRLAICAHLRRSRAVHCDPSRIIVVNGSQQALDLITRVLIERGDAVAIEDPAYHGIVEVLRAAGARLLPVPVDRHESILAAYPQARAAYS